MTLRFFLVVASMLAAFGAHAHHGWSSYGSHETRTVRGTIVEASYRHPHAAIRLQTAERTWLAVLAPPAHMSSRGLPGNSRRVGDTATVEGYASRRLLTRPVPLRRNLGHYGASPGCGETPRDFLAVDLGRRGDLRPHDRLLLIRR